jgi:hypothetical protein
MEPYRGIMMRISCPESFITWGSVPETSANPPVFANGSTSLDTKRILRGFDILFSPGDKTVINTYQFTKIPGDKQFKNRTMRSHEFSFLES